MRFSNLLWTLTLLACGKTSEIAAIDDAGGGSGGASDGGGGNGGSTGGTAGNGGGVGGASTGGTGAGTAQDLTHYHGCELPTGAIRYAIYKADPTRDLCFQIVIASTSAPFHDIEVVPEDFGVEGAHVWQGASSCGNNWPVPSGAIAATGGTGKIEIL